VQAWERERGEELERASRVFREACDKAAAEAQRMAAVERHEQARAKLHGELLELRERKVRVIVDAVLHGMCVSFSCCFCCACGHALETCLMWFRFHPARTDALHCLHNTHIFQLVELEAKAREAAEAARRQRLLEEREAQARLQEARVRHQQIAQYHREQQAQLRELEERRRQEEEEAAKEAARQAVVNKQRVDVRVRMYQVRGLFVCVFVPFSPLSFHMYHEPLGCPQNKVDERAHLQRQQQIEREQRERRIAELAKQTPYFERIEALEVLSTCRNARLLSATALRAHKACSRGCAAGL